MSNVENVVERYGSSCTFLDYVVRHQVSEMKPNSVVDFGAGAGKNGKLIREVLGSACTIVAVEGYPQTARTLSESGPYDEVTCELLQGWHANSTQHYDLAVYGDVLEHLTPKEIRQVMDSRRALL
jgi:2-polyprenyl-3-methyl-5-hydroxy-6-metoxy-1,4-benzoquinol methylase